MNTSRVKGLYLIFAAVLFVFCFQPNGLGLANLQEVVLTDTSMQTPGAFLPSMDTVVLDVVVRDFQDTHPDFEGEISNRVTGLVASTLGEDGRPVYVGPEGEGSITNQETFNQWYNDVEGVNLKTIVQIPLTRVYNTSNYLYETYDFFPIDDQLYGNQGREHNYHFTLELHTNFTYYGGEIFEFMGDDDVWVFINRQLVIDLGGIHPVDYDQVALDTLGLTPGATYTLDMFFAERRTISSRFMVSTTIDASTTPFLDLPVNYVDFGQAVQGNTGPNTGLINAWFDHSRPGLGEDGVFQRWDGSYGDTQVDGKNCQPSNGNFNNCYDGHDGLDIKQTGTKGNPVLSAAAGLVFVAEDDLSSKFCVPSMGKCVQIDHQNCYMTLYGHLASIDPSIRYANLAYPIYLPARKPIGIMGNTGQNVNGTHLHFGVYKDPNCDGDFSDRIPVDPFGWALTNADPWPQNPKQPLWIHPLGQQVTIGSAGGTVASPSGNYSANIPAQVIVDPITLELLAVPTFDDPGVNSRFTGDSFWLRAFEWLSPTPSNADKTLASTTNGFDQDVSITVHYSDDSLLHVKENQLSLFAWDETEGTWHLVPSTIDMDTNIVTSLTTRTGRFTLQAPLMCSSDFAEPDDEYLYSRSIRPNGGAAVALFDVEQDEDWFQVLGQAGGLYTIHTTGQTGGVSPVLTVYRSDGGTQWATSEGSADPGSLSWTAPASEIYYIQVSRAAGSLFGCEAAFNIYLRGENLNVQEIYIPFVQK